MCCSTLHVEGWRVEEMGREDDTPIHSAARDGDLATVKDLVAEGFGPHLGELAAFLEMINFANYTIGILHHVHYICKL